MKKQQMEKIDARINVGFASHPKTKMLLKRNGPEAVLRLLYLILWARANRSDGDLSGMSDEEIELAVDWPGGTGLLMRALRDHRFIDGPEGESHLHDWADHQPWAVGSDDRRQRAAWSALVRHHGVDAAAREMPEYAAKLREAQENKRPASGENANSTPPVESSNAPSPSPNRLRLLSSKPPTPDDQEDAGQEDAPGGAGGGGGQDAVPPKPRRRRPAAAGGVVYTEAFEAWWAEYPPIRRTDKPKCFAVWKAKRLGDDLDMMLKDLITRKAEHWGWVKNGGEFVPAPLVYLRNDRWTDEIVDAPQGSKRQNVEAQNKRLLEGWADRED